jgi:serine/threonine protein phosphatase PrpC
VEAVSEEDEMVVLATDGVFEVMSNEEVVEFIKATG